MPHILFAWELGDGLGHVLRMLPLAKALTAAGHRCSFAVRDIRHAGRYIRKAGFSYLPAPSYLPGPPRRPLRGLADILALVGYDDPDHLEALIVAWGNLFETVGADLVVCDYAPTACLAAAGRCPVVEIGDSFTSPPAKDGQFLRMDGTWGPTDGDEAVLRTIRTVQDRLSKDVSSSLPDAIRPPHDFLVTLPELCGPDAHAHGGTIVGPLIQLPAPDHRTARVGYFAYLSAEAKGVRDALAALAESGEGGEIYLRNARPDILAEASRLGLTVHTRPQDLTEAVGKARCLIHHGGLGTSEMGLAVGRPQLLIPRHQEQVANALRLRRLGCAVAMQSGGRYRAENIRQALFHILDAKFERSAAAVATGIAGRADKDGLERVRDRCLALLTPQIGPGDNPAVIPSAHNV